MAMVDVQESAEHLTNFQRSSDVAQITQTFRRDQILCRSQKCTCLENHSSFGEAILSFIIL